MGSRYLEPEKVVGREWRVPFDLAGGAGAKTLSRDCLASDVCLWKERDYVSLPYVRQSRSVPGLTSFCVGFATRWARVYCGGIFDLADGRVGGFFFYR